MSRGPCRSSSEVVCSWPTTSASSLKYSASAKVRTSRWNLRRERQAHAAGKPWCRCHSGAGGRGHARCTQLRDELRRRAHGLGERAHLRVTSCGRDQPPPPAAPSSSSPLPPLAALALGGIAEPLHAGTRHARMAARMAAASRRAPPARRGWSWAVHVCMRRCNRSACPAAYLQAQHKQRDTLTSIVRALLLIGVAASSPRGGVHASQRCMPRRAAAGSALAHAKCTPAALKSESRRRKSSWLILPLRCWSRPFDSSTPMTRALNASVASSASAMSASPPSPPATRSVPSCSARQVR